MTEAAASSNDPEKIKDAQKRAKALEKRDAEDLAAVLATPEGRRFVRGLLVDCHEHRSVFDTNAIHMAFKEGARNVGLKLKARIGQVAPEWLGELLKSC